MKLWWDLCQARLAAPWLLSNSKAWLVSGEWVPQIDLFSRQWPSYGLPIPHQSCVYCCRWWYPNPPLFVPREYGPWRDKHISRHNGPELGCWWFYEFECRCGKRIGKTSQSGQCLIWDHPKREAKHWNVWWEWFYKNSHEWQCTLWALMYPGGLKLTRIRSN